ncbi:MAG: metallophosphoesterase, partial [Candidatus Thorarchaeota archaeon]
MKILVVSDLHRSKTAAMQSANVAEVEEVDHILVLGDISHNDFKEATILLELIADTKDVYFVPGNMDSKKLLNWANDKIRNIHCKVVHYKNGLEIMGIGGSTITPFNTMIEFNEDEMMSMLYNTSRNLKSKDFILVSHCPPKNTKVDKTNSGVHIGSQSIRKFI